MPQDQVPLAATIMRAVSTWQRCCQLHCRCGGHVILLAWLPQECTCTTCPWDAPGWPRQTTSTAGATASAAFGGHSLASASHTHLMPSVAPDHHGHASVLSSQRWLPGAAMARLLRVWPSWLIPSSSGGVPLPSCLQECTGGIQLCIHCCACVSVQRHCTAHAQRPITWHWNHVGIQHQQHSASFTGT